MGRISARRPATARSQFMLEVASELVAAADFELRQARISLRRQGDAGWPLTLLASDGPDAMASVVSGLVTVGIVNPSVLLRLASRGIPPFRGPMPLCALAVIPSDDQLAVAVRPETGLSSLEEVRDRRYPLRLSVRGQRDHGVHLVTEHVLTAHGWTTGDLLSWGGSVSYDDGLPSRGDRVGMLARGEIDAIIDEAVGTWVDDAIDAGGRVLPLSASGLTRLEAWGYQPSDLTPSQFPGLLAAVPTIDFSGFGVYVRADLADETVDQICRAIVARRDSILLQDGTPLPLDQISVDPPVPLHRAAERFWAEGGYR
jgi:NMT1-like family